MGTYTHTMQSSEYSLFFRPGSNWSNYARLYDGDVSSAPTSQSGSIGIKLDMSWLPSGMRLSGIYARIGAKRTDSSGFNVWLRSTDSSGDTSTYYALAELPMRTGAYNVYDWHGLIVTQGGIEQPDGTPLQITKQQSADFMALTNKYLSMNASPYKSEIDITWYYTEADDIPIYVGGNRISAVYVGTTRASAVYVGTTKIL